MKTAFKSSSVKDLRLAGRQIGTASIELEPLGQVALSGQLVSAPITRDLSIEAVYMAHWGNIFFGVLDGIMPSFIVATSKVAADGTFTLTVPDLASDPVVASFVQDPSLDVLRLIARETETGNIPYRLEEIQQSGREVSLPIWADYPQGLLLVAVFR